MSNVLRHFVFAALATTLAACGSDAPTAPSSTGSAPFQVIDIRVGTGTEAVNGRDVTVAYAGWLYSNTAPENKGNRFETGVYTFTLGSRQVIQGWDRGILGMRVGGQRRLVIPPELAYGSSSPDPRIPSNATLLFDVELQNVR